MSMWSLKGWKEKYDELVLMNAETVGQIEGTLRTCLYLIPGRLRDSEVKAELAYTTVNLVSLYHDYLTCTHLLRRGIPTSPLGTPLPPLYSLSLSRSLSLFHATELFVEMFCKDKFGDRARWAAVLLIELCKAFLRFKMLYRTNGNILVHQTIPSRDASASPFQKIDRSLDNVIKSMPPLPNEKKERKTLLDYQNEQKRAKSLKSLLAAEPTQNTLMALLPPPPPPNKASRLCGESLHILRPLIYLASMYVYGQSWKAWLISLGTDLSSYYCLTYPDKLNKIEKSEIRRRTYLWLYYLLRSPFFDAVAGDSIVGRSFAKLKSISAFQRILGPLFDYLLAYRQHYFYTSAS